MTEKNYMVIGGLGFIGSNVTKRLLIEETGRVYLFDNYSSGRIEHIGKYADNERLTIIKGDIKNKEELVLAMENDIDIIYILASNPDIARAAIEPEVDFWEGTYLVNNVLESMRITGKKKLIYASGSGVYGDVGATVTDENFSPMRPTSTYGASKLGCEALICAYCHMFDMKSAVFRFANVIGPSQTHGVGYDFLRKLRKNPNTLEILGDGTQSKSYIYVDDVIDAVRLVEKKGLNIFEPYNVATLDNLTVTEIADMAVSVLGLSDVEYKYTGGNRGWKGDVPVVRMNSKKIRDLGWSNRHTSHEAMELALRSMLQEV